MEVWIGLVGVLPLKEDTCIAGAKGAYVNTLALVGTATEYRRVVATALEDMALFAFEFEDVERLSERMLRRSLPAKIVERADDARRSGEVTFAEFHTFGAWDA